MNINLVGLLLNVLAGITAAVSVAYGSGVHSASGLFAAGVAGTVPAVSGFLTNKHASGGSASVLGTVPAPIEETLLAVADEIKRSQLVRKQQEAAAAVAAQQAQQAAADRAAQLREELAKLEAGQVVSSPTPAPVPAFLPITPVQGEGVSRVENSGSLSR